VENATDGDAVIGVVERARLSGALTEVHRSGQGHNARVLDPARGDLRGQLRRSGVQVDLGLDPRAKDNVLVLIHAPGRTAKTAELLRRAGASPVHVVGRVGAVVPQPILSIARAPTRPADSEPSPTSD
jgi:hypothetical protein